MRTMSKALEEALARLGRTERREVMAGLQSIVNDGRRTRLDDLFAGLVIELAIDDANERTALAEADREMDAHRREAIATMFPDGLPPLPKPPMQSVEIPRDTP